MHRPVIGYTLGDQAGIGPEIMRAALAAMQGEQAVFRPMGPAIAATPGHPRRKPPRPLSTSWKPPPPPDTAAVCSGF